MAFSGKSIKALESTIGKVAGATDWTVYQKLWYDIPSCFYYVLINKNNNFLALDFLSDNPGIGKYGFKTSLLTKDCSMHDGVFPIPNSTMAFCYKFVKRIVKQMSLDNDIKYLQSHYQKADKQRTRKILLEHFGNEAQSLLTSILDHERFSLGDKDMKSLLSFKMRQLKKNTSGIERRYHHHKRIINRILHPCGMVLYTPELSEAQRNELIKILKNKVSFLFRFVTESKGNFKSDMKGFAGSTLVIYSTKNFNSEKALKTHWLPPSRRKLEVTVESIKDIELCAENYFQAILEELRKRHRILNENITLSIRM